MNLIYVHLLSVKYVYTIIRKYNNSNKKTKTLKVRILISSNRNNLIWIDSKYI